MCCIFMDSPSHKNILPVNFSVQQIIKLFTLMLYLWSAHSGYCLSLHIPCTLTCTRNKHASMQDTIKVNQGTTKMLCEYLLYNDERVTVTDACDKARSASTSLYYLQLLWAYSFLKYFDLCNMTNHQKIFCKK